MMRAREGRRWKLGMLVALVVARAAAAQIASDRAAAVVVYPAIQVDAVDNIDTLIQLSNTGPDPVRVRCFYVNVNSHCSNTGAICTGGADCGGGLCLPSWIETDFEVRLTPRQPLAWRAGVGLAEFPLDGATRRSADGQSNAGSHVPPVSEEPFLGELRCVVVDEQARPIDRNVLVGSATTEQAQTGLLDVTRYNAIGIPAIFGANNGDNTLVVGEEYQSCPDTLIVDHFFDDAADPVTGEDIYAALALVPCGADFVLLSRNAPSITAQFLVYNEFEQRFSTSTPVRCFALLPLSNIDTTQAPRSLFSVGVAGTLVGQTRIRGVATGAQGLLGVYFEGHGDHSAAANLHFQGSTDHVDLIALP